MWKGPREFLSYTTKRRNGILVFLLVILALWFGLLFFDFKDNTREVDILKFEDRIKEWEVEKQRKMLSTSHSLFPFDPNVASDSVFRALGLSESLSSRIRNYTAKGGVFRNDKDLLKMYGIDSTWYKKVEPYIRITPKNHPKEKVATVKKLRSFDINRDNIETLRASGLELWEAKRIINYRGKVGLFSAKRELFKLYGFDSLRVEEMMPFVQIDKEIDSSGFEKVAIVLVEINSSDSLTLLKIKGIGPSFSKRILKYRSNLGGFVRKEQLLEVYGLNVEKLESIKGQIYVDPDKVEKLNINEASFKTLLKHPYLDYEQVKSIVQFREKVRPFEALEELKNIDGISLELYKKLLPYLRLN